MSIRNSSLRSSKAFRKVGFANDYIVFSASPLFEFVVWEVKSRFHFTVSTRWCVSFKRERHRKIRVASEARRESAFLGRSALSPQEQLVPRSESMGPSALAHCKADLE